MFSVLQVLTVILVAVAMALSLAHALELPGKMQLTKDAYLAVQTIYYPGFTIGGISEPVGIISTIILLVLTPLGRANFWLTLVALLGLIGMQAVYWLFTACPVRTSAKLCRHYWERFNSGYLLQEMAMTSAIRLKSWTRPAAAACVQSVLFLGGPVR